jgi:hypothetical protein
MLFSDGDSAHRHSAIPSGEGLDDDPGESPSGFHYQPLLLQTGVSLLKNSACFSNSKYALFSGDSA